MEDEEVLHRKIKQAIGRDQPQEEEAEVHRHHIVADGVVVVRDGEGGRREI